MTNLEYRARLFATKMHAGQVRKYTGVPYIVHPTAVVDTLRTVRHNDDMLCAGWLHDVVEDTDTSLATIEALFGLHVASLVEMVTNVSRPEDGNRATRAAIEREHLAKANWEGQTIKLADLIDNTRDITAHDPKFAVVYLDEKSLLLEVLDKGDFELMERAKEQLRAQASQ